MKRFLPAVLCAALPLLLTVASSDGRADIKPGHLVAGPISWDGKFAIGEIYVGGTYGQIVPGGRRAILEVSESGKGWHPLTSVTLPDIGSTRPYYLAYPLGKSKGSITIRLSISPASAFPQQDVSTRTFPGPFGKLNGEIDALKRNQDGLPFKK